MKIVLGSGTIAAALTPLVALALTPLLFGGAVIDSGRNGPVLGRCFQYAGRHDAC